MQNKYIPIIGLEVHVELSTGSKMFCSCSANHFGVKPNTQTCPVCLGLPGALPYANWEAVTRCVKLGLAYGCSINSDSKFDRKHYFYPDLPKGYQITQFDKPFCLHGLYKRGDTIINIRRIHMEEDTGKMVHTTISGKRVSLVDFNRSGVPLVEMVTEPDFHDSISVTTFLKEFQKTVRYLGISDADMEKGSLRLEANISLSDINSYGRLPGYKVELKNINSFRFLNNAIDAEIDRQTAVLDNGDIPLQETRGYNETSGKTFSQRTKEDAHDYRYFPEPDIPPIHLTKLQIDDLASQIPQLPQEKEARYTKYFGIKESYASILAQDLARATKFEEAVEIGKKHNIAAADIAAAFVNGKIDGKYGSAVQIVEFLKKNNNRDYASFTEVESAVKELIAKGTAAVDDFRNGKEAVIGFLIGMVQKSLDGKGDPGVVREVLLKHLRDM